MMAIERTPLPARRLEWQRAEVREIIVETPRVKSIRLRVDNRQRHRSGQHVDIRLTAAGGYQAQRSYSIASPPEDGLVALTVERVDNGEVSPYLVEDLRLGDQFELRGPIGGYFVWTTAMTGPLWLIAGGSGVVPLMAMLRHRDKGDRRVPAILLYSSRSFDDIIYRNELAEMTSRDLNLKVVNTLTRKQPEGWTGHRGRIDRPLLAKACFSSQEQPNIFICGPTSFVEHVSMLVVELGHDPITVKTERFGPSGG